RSLYEIKKKLLEKNAVCIFTEPQFNSNIIDVIIRGTNIHKGILDPLGIKTSLGKRSYLRFLLQLSNQYISCLQKN
ncbi:zinc ABC transporter substrate-binding protein ZnuA, partial [Escherichia coli]|nr:zinc ABC transporter substrate-binding protein ZnuA [Escherichia coli]